jgi:hypothetical protein
MRKFRDALKQSIKRKDARNSTPADRSSCRADEQCLACFHLRDASATDFLSI